MELFDFQKEGVDFLLSKKRAFLCDEMGLGKTAQAINAVLKGRLTHCLVICPATLKYNWENEFKNWNEKAELSVKIFNKQFDNSDVLIVNYDQLAKNMELLLNVNWKCVIIDESHYIKNKKTKRTQHVLDLTKNVPYVFCLTGTPLVNRPIEIHTQLSAMNRLTDVAKNEVSFLFTFCNPVRKTFYKKFGGIVKEHTVTDFSGHSNIDKLSSLMSNFLLRRTKKEVLKQIPDKFRIMQSIPVDSKVFKEYQEKEEEFEQIIDELAQIEDGFFNAQYLVKLTYLREVIIKCKMEVIINWINDFFENNENEKLVVFGFHKAYLNKLKTEFADFNPVLLTGEQNAKERQEAVDTFQNDKKCRLFIGNIKAGGVGITLTASSNMLITELPWTPADLLQVEDRIYRIGQDQNCTIYYLLANGTVENKMYKMLIDKANVISQLIKQEKVATSKVTTF